MKYTITNIPSDPSAVFTLTTCGVHTEFSSQRHKSLATNKYSVYLSTYAGVVFYPRAADGFPAEEEKVVIPLQPYHTETFNDPLGFRGLHHFFSNLLIGGGDKGEDNVNVEAIKEMLLRHIPADINFMANNYGRPAQSLNWCLHREVEGKEPEPILLVIISPHVKFEDLDDPINREHLTFREIVSALIFYATFVGRKSINMLGTERTLVEMFKYLDVGASDSDTHMMRAVAYSAFTELWPNITVLDAEPRAAFMEEAEVVKGIEHSLSKGRTGAAALAIHNVMLKHFG